MLSLPHAIITIDFDMDEPIPRKHNIDIGICPAANTGTAWTSRMLTDIYHANTLEDAKLRSLELLNQYVTEIQEEVKLYLKTTITET